jgi:acid stress-induced BolA-like protein IbaG/YrbA
MQTHEITTLIHRVLPSAQVDVVDTVGDGNHFQATVIAEEFIGLTMLKQHKMVYEAVQDYLDDGRLHALSLKTYTPEQWQALAAKA